MKSFEKIAYTDLDNRGIDILSPKTIQDKINWLKFHDSTPLKALCADKIRNGEYCKKILGEDITVPIIKVYDSVNDINLDELPSKFVLKCNHGYHMNIICKDKSKFSLREAKLNLNKWLKTDFGYDSFQPHYSLIEPKVFAEEYMEDELQKQSLYDYKFWCFNGEPKLFTINDGVGHGDIVYYDMDKNKLNLYGLKSLPNHEYPKHYDEMVEYAKKLSKDFSFVRVDFYEVNGKVYLGELTFTPGRGMFRYASSEYDLKVGNMLSLPNKNYKEGVSICVTAYKVKNFIEEALDSIENQTWFKTHNNWEVIVGVDGCKETLSKIQSIRKKYKNLRVLMMDTNKGTYVTTNTVMDNAKYKWLFRFDSDDIMNQDMVEYVMRNKKDCDLIRFKYKNFGGNNDVNYSLGQICINHDVFDYFGGYLPWSCSADAELYVRLKHFVKCFEIDRVLFMRRIHKNNLTVSKDTNFSSSVRKENISYIKTFTHKIKDKKNAIVIKVTNTFKEIDCDLTITFTEEKRPIKMAKKKIRAKKIYNYTNQIML